MKLNRNHLLIIIAAMGFFMIGYGIFRYFTGIEIPEKIEKYVFDIIIFGALGLFVYNRKLAKDEKAAKAAKEEAERRAAEEAENPEEEQSENDASDDENLPHWERHKTHKEPEEASKEVKEESLSNWENRE